MLHPGSSRPASPSRMPPTAHPSVPETSTQQRVFHQASSHLPSFLGRLPSLFMLLLILLFTLPILSAAFTVTLTPDTILLRPGETGTSTLHIAATQGNTTITRLAINTSQVENLTVTFSVPSIPLFIQNGSAENITISVSYDAPWPQGSYLLPIQIEDNTSNYTNATLTVTLLPAHTDTGFTISPSTIDLGSSTQERDAYVVSTLHLGNDQNHTMSNLTFTFTGRSAYNLTLTPQGPYTLQPYQNMSLQIRAYVPRDQDAGRVKIGDLVYTAVTGENGSIPVYLTTRSIIRVKNIDVTSSEGDDTTLSNGDRIGIDFTPGSTGAFHIDIENRASRTDMNTLRAILTLKQIDAGDDIVVESDTVDLPSDDTTTLTLNFTIPYSTRRDVYDVTLRIEGDDEYGARHSVEYSFELRVTRKAHDIRIKRLDVPMSVTCQEGTLPIQVTLVNTGRYDEASAWVNVSIPFGPSIRRVILLKKSGSDAEKTLRISLPLTGLKEGPYTLEVRAGYDKQAYLTDYEEASFTLVCPRRTEQTSTPSQQANETLIILSQSGMPTDSTLSQEGASSPTGEERVPQNGSAGTPGEQGNVSAAQEARIFGLSSDVFSLIIANALILGMIGALIILAL